MKNYHTTSTSVLHSLVSIFISILIFDFAYILLSKQFV